MSAYIPVELQRQVRTHFRDCCAYCRTAESLTVAIFEFEHIIPRSVGAEKNKVVKVNLEQTAAFTAWSQVSNSDELMIGR
ncbi:hypothetical protein NDI49_19350 [Trichocoleus sp. ST-U3]